MGPLTNRQKTKIKYKSRYISLEGPGVWCTCIRGKEKQVIGELIDVFESIGDELWPQTNVGNVQGGGTTEAQGGDDEEEEEDLEKQLARELKALKAPRKDRRFKNVTVDVGCLVFISCAPPVEPVKLVLEYLKEIESTKRARTRNAQRMVPVVDSCIASVDDIVRLAKRVLPPVFESEPPNKYRYKIELKVRNNSKITKDILIPELAKTVPLDRGHVVDLENPEMVIFVEVYKGTCGMSVVPDWIKFKRFNIMELAQSLNRAGEPAENESRIVRADQAT